MKTYMTPEIKLEILQTNDVITASNTSVVWSDADGEYLVAAADNWWS